MRVSTTVLPTIMLTFAALGIGGCQGRVMAPGAGRADPILRDNYPAIVAEQELGKFLFFSEPLVVVRPDQPMSVTVPVRLRSDTEVSAQYRFEFFDERHRPLRPEPQWRFIRLPARTPEVLEGVPLATPAADLRLIAPPAT